MKRLHRDYGLEWSQSQNAFYFHRGRPSRKLYLYALLLNYMLKEFDCEVYWGTHYYRITYAHNIDATVPGVRS